MAQLLTLADLAERWQCPISGAKATAQRGAIPYVRLGSSDLKTPWRLRRWRLADVEAWETENREAPQAEPEAACKRPAAGRFLGDWSGN